MAELQFQVVLKEALEDCTAAAVAAEDTPIFPAVVLLPAQSA